MSFTARAYGKYFLLEKIATGGMAEVFKAKTFGVQGFERLVVIKQILPHLTKDSDFVEMFIDEAKISVELTHANIVQVYDLGKVGDNYFIAMECINGKDLRALLKKSISVKRSIPISHTAHIIAEMLKGLDYAHNKKDAKTNKPLNIIHRDISPQNIVISYDGDVKIVDFGIAKAERRINQTQAGVLKGKFGYMSPEQAMGYEVDRRSDIFACGILLFEMLTSRRLFMGENDLDTLELIREADVPPIQKYNESVPEELAEIAYRALQRDVDDRYPDARSMQRDLSKFMFEYNPDFSVADLSIYLKDLFEREIGKERKSLEAAIAQVEKKYGDNKVRARVDQLEEVSFVHPNPQTAATEVDPRSDSSMPSKITTGADSATYPTSSPSLSQPSRPSIATGTRNEIANERTQYQPKQSGTFQKDFVDGEKEEKGSLLSALMPFLIPSVLVGTILVLVWFNFFRKPSVPQVEATPTPQAPVVGVIDLVTEPPGAEAYLGEQLLGQTPLTAEVKSGQDQAFMFRLQGYESKVMTLFVTEGTNQPLKVSLDPDRATLASLRVASSPSGAKIFFNGEETGKRTPYTFQNLKRGQEVALRLYKRGYEPAEATLNLDLESTEKSFNLVGKLADLTVETDPPGAEVFLNSRSLGKSPALASLRMNQTVTIEARLQGHETARQKFRVKQATESIRLTLKQVIPQFGYISINADPWATVFLDGELLGNTPILKRKVTTGDHQVEFRHADYGKQVETISVKKTHTEQTPLIIIKDLKK